MIKLGYSLGVGPRPKYSIKDRIKILASVENCAIELSYGAASRLEEELDDEDVQEIKKFKYISIHAPSFSEEKDNLERKRIKYPSPEAEAVIDKILKTAKITGAKAIVFHPDLVNDFNWLNGKIGNRLALENMSAEKLFGKSVRDLEIAFSQAPKAKWVCDVNHIYTMDRSMKLAGEFHKAFADKLCHYHLSGYGGLHDCLYLSREDIILEGIKNFSAPIIHEGGALRDGLASLSQENKYILERLTGLTHLKI